jgi:hypothetical protein
MSTENESPNVGNGQQDCDNQDLLLERVLTILNQHDIKITDVEKILNGYFNPGVELSMRRDECILLEMLKETRTKLLSEKDMNNEFKLFLSANKLTEDFYDSYYENELHKFRAEYSNKKEECYVI